MTKRTLIIIGPLLATLLAWYLFFARYREASVTAGPSGNDAASFSKKLAQLNDLGNRQTKSTLEFRQAEIDSYIQHELKPLFPKGLEQVKIELGQGLVSANSLINFDELESTGSRNPLLTALFRGEHTLDVVAAVKTQNKTGSYEVSKVLLDEREIPKPLVDLLIDKYVVRKYPTAKPNSPFPLPYNIDRVEIMPGKLIVHQNGK